MRQIKVLYLAQHLTIGGAEQLLLGIASGLPPDRFEVVVGCLTREGLIAGELRRAGVRVVFLPGEPGPRDVRAFRRLLRFIRAERPHVVHTFLLNAGLYGRLAAWLARVPAIYHAEQNVYFRKSRRHLLFERFLAPRTTRVVACCRAVGEFYRRQVGLDPRRLEVINNAVDFAAVEPRADRDAARAELGYGPTDVVFGCLGRLAEQKGHDVLLEALVRTPDLQAPRVFIAGQGPRQLAIEVRAEQLGLRDRLQLLGVRRDRETLYAAVDVFVLPSRWEGLSLALVEAAGLGLPIVATDVGGNAEVVRPASDVWLVRPDDPTALGAALSEAERYIYSQRFLGGTRRSPRPAIRDRFSLARHLAQLETSYRSALGWDNLPTPVSRGDGTRNTLTPSPLSRARERELGGEGAHGPANPGAEGQVGQPPLLLGDGGGEGAP